MRQTTEQLKQQAAEQAVTFIESGMVVGLGTGSTAVWAVRHLAKLLVQGQLHDIIVIPTSLNTAQEAERLGIPLTTLEDHPVVNLTIDGADEVAPNLDVIKGGGGALLREKIVAQASQRLILIVDESKRSSVLGTKWALPVEVIPFGWSSQRAWLESIGANVSLRTVCNGSPLKTDQGNLILDCNFGLINAPDQLAEQLNRRAGIVEHGLFLGMADDVIVAGQAGIQHLVRGDTG